MSWNLSDFQGLLQLEHQNFYNKTWIQSTWAYTQLENMSILSQETSLQEFETQVILPKY